MHIITEVFLKSLQKSMFSMILFLLKYTLYFSKIYTIHRGKVYKDTHSEYYQGLYLGGGITGILFSLLYFFAF